MGLTDLLHSVAVLGTCSAYLLPLYEALQRRSAFYVAVFATTVTLSFALHCEESGLCRPFAPPLHEKLRAVSQGASVFLAGLMALIVFEIRNEWAGRALMALWAVGAVARDADDTPFNLGGVGALAAVLLLVDALLFRRQFNAAWWKRLALISAGLLLGAALFRLVHGVWWHGVWHAYVGLSIYLLMLAQRTKRMLARCASISR
jgi:hypothetical protein